MANKKFNDMLSKKSEEVINLISEKNDNGVSTVNNGSRAIGTPFTVVAALSVHEPVQQGNGPWLGWDCSEKNARGNARVLTPNGLGQFSSYPDAEWQGDTKDAFKVESSSYEEQIEEMEKFLKDGEGKVKIVAKAKHPRFEGQWMYAYGVAE